MFATLAEEISLRKSLLRNNTYTASPLVAKVRTRIADLEPESTLMCNWLDALSVPVPAEPEPMRNGTARSNARAALVPLQEGAQSILTNPSNSSFESGRRRFCTQACG